MNFFQCPFESTQEIINSRDEKEIESKYPYTREDLFVLHEISFAIEQAITTFFEITKQNEIIFEVDFVNDRVQEILLRAYPKTLPLLYVIHAQTKCNIAT